MGSEAENREAFRIQQHYCETMGAPITARIAGALAAAVTRESRTGARVLDWAGEPTRGALPLRLVGGLHALALAGADEALARVFAGAGDAGGIEPVLRRVLVAQDAALLPWLDGPPQTNEPGRSAALMTGLLHVARRHGPRLEVLEIGSSAGLNLLLDRFRFDLGGVAVGSADAPLLIRPEWRGSPPPAVPVAFRSVRGCDIQPLDATDPEVAARLAAYVWADNPERLERLRTAIALLREHGVALDRADAADWLDARLAEPQEAGVTRVLMHSVVWQYLPDATQHRVQAAMAGAAAVAAPVRPLAWVRMEPDRQTAQQHVLVASWPGHAEQVTVADAQAHGAWIAGRAG
ncbi:DUF2332 domain-containing protein [Sphingomonas aracearum]|uniref:DUF2332 family protein n=1 Tax=Sphingomonas aracearum TaxID=2283317 RepID=A0A369VV01_9SPHN|nr:DUF2332 family protein [Sphingomonas aracearum]RDE04902.1 DUF2332 family protein [Sphingomonas aracearum]